uniref:Uncharacterized protein n=1 Tax=Ananas comosus var. bracteatus TaxID=296719 RepID=A0A6V7QJL8_ANACO|nr:unnamed protein product [Ananas comosus var. bracteatus]
MTPPFAQLLPWLHQHNYNFHANPYNFILLALTSFFIFMVLYNRRGGGGGGCGCGGDNETDRAKLPSPPGRLPVLGHLHRLGPLPHRSLRALAQAHGPIMLLHMGRAHDASFSGWPSSGMAHELMYGARDVAFAPYGEYWRQVRRTCVLHLLSLRRVRSLRPVREEESALMVREIARLAELGAEFNVSELVVRLTNDIVCRAAFGRKYGGGGAGAEGGVGAVREALAEFVRLLGTVQIGEFVAGLGGSNGGGEGWIGGWGPPRGRWMGFWRGCWRITVERGGGVMRWTAVIAMMVGVVATTMIDKWTVVISSTCCLRWRKRIRNWGSHLARIASKRLFWTCLQQELILRTRRSNGR